MELWIRSQHKNNLVKINSLEIRSVHYDYYTYPMYEIIGNETIALGVYNGFKVNEVLDEIQKLLQPQMVLSKVGKPIAETCDGTVYSEPNEYDFKEISTYVYEMPKE